MRTENHPCISENAEASSSYAVLTLQELDQQLDVRIGRSRDAGPASLVVHAHSLQVRLPEIPGKAPHKSERVAWNAISDRRVKLGRYEMSLRLMEARLGATLTASGAIYGLRRECYRPLTAADLIDDFVVPMRCVPM